MRIATSKLNHSDIADGLAWYKTAHNEAHRIAQAWGVDFLKVCGIISALSPSVAWNTNLKDAEKMIAHLVYKQPPPVVSTYGPNMFKAIDIFDSEGDRETIEKILLGVAGWKTHSFFLNISGLDENSVTVDRHVLKAIGFSEKSLTKNRYYDIVGKFKRKAKKMKVAPMDLQAMVWVNYKRLNNI